YVLIVTVTAATCVAFATYRTGVQLSFGLLAFVVLATLTDLREIRLPFVGIVTLSFVPVLASLIVLGLWPALVVAMVSGVATAGFTRDPLKVVFNVSNYVASTFVAGLVFIVLVPATPGLVDEVVPAFLATLADFFVSTLLLAGVLAFSTGSGPLTVWRRNYQWALPGYLTGATFALLAAWLYEWLGIAGLVLALPPLILIYYSYEIYVSRAHERVTFDAERDSFHDELATSVKLHDELRTAQLKVAAEIERARRIQTDLLPASTPEVEGLQLEQRIAFLGEMGGDYYDYIPFGDGRLGIVCGDVMGKGLAAALIMAMARSLLHDAIGPGKRPGDVLAEVNDGLTRDLEGQRLPYFLTLALAVYDPDARSLRIAGGGHNPVLVCGADGVRQVPSRGAALGVRTGLQFPEDEIALSTGDSVALYTDGLTEARSPANELFGMERLEAAFERCREQSLDETLGVVWEDIAAFRDGVSPSDDATLLLARLA
ncbi:MAG TPA: PP2C family protein-serine/threonine phosphatase, partial [Thermoleophilia bacterium]